MGFDCYVEVDYFESTVESGFGCHTVVDLVGLAVMLGLDSCAGVNLVGSVIEVFTRHATFVMGCAQFKLSQ